MSRASAPANVIVLVIDSLCFRRLGVGGNRPSPSPTLDGLFQAGLSFSNCFAVGCPSDFGLLGLMTSSLPLDFGGYQHGLKLRPRTVAECLKASGYTTAFFTPLPYPPAWGNRRGYDDLRLFYDMGSYLVEVESSARWYRDLAGLHPDQKEAYLEQCAVYLEMMFADIAWHCEVTRELLGRGEVSRSLMLHDYDLDAVRRWAQASRESLSRDRRGYVAELWRGASDNAALAPLRSIVEARRRSPHTLRVDRAARGTLRWALANLYVRSLARRTGRTARWQARLRLQRGQDVSVRFPSARYTLDNLLRWVDRHDSRPFLAWAHLMDVHEMNFSSFDVPEAAGAIEGEMDRARRQMLRICGRMLGYTGNPLYDLGIGYVDQQVARLVAALKQRGLLDNTVLLLTADHGHTHVAWPPREDVHVTSHFYDELYHVPVAFVGRGVPARSIMGLTSAMDVAPTLLGMLGLPPCASFSGHDLHCGAESSRDHLVMEHMGSGHGDFQAKAVLLCVRSRTDKIVYVQPPPREAKPGYLREWYCLRGDPREMTNLAGVSPPSAEALRLVVIARQRLAALYEENRLGPVPS